MTYQLKLRGGHLQLTYDHHTYLDEHWHSLLATYEYVYCALWCLNMLKDPANIFYISIWVTYPLKLVR